MPLSEAAHAIESLQFFTAIRESALVYPVLLACHLSGMALFGGLVLITDLRLFGRALQDGPAGEWIAQSRPWKRAGFAVMAITGLLLAGAKASLYYPNPYFRWKITLLILACLYSGVIRRVPEGRLARVAGALSLILWLGILSAGRLIAYYEP
jgi:hypothetical protein